MGNIADAAGYYSFLFTSLNAILLDAMNKRVFDLPIPDLQPQSSVCFMISLSYRVCFDLQKNVATLFVCLLR